MLRTMLVSKIHRATVTQTDLNYVGSITIDKDLMDAVGMLPFEKVEIYNITNGQRFQTYTIVGEPGSGIIGINGAAARLVAKNDKVIIVNFAQYHPDELETYKPKVVIVDDDNKIIEEI